MNQVNIQYFQTAFGELILGSFNGKLCLCDWRYRKMRAEIDQRIQKGLEAEYKENDTREIQIARQQLIEYFTGERSVFDIAHRLVGTTFQQSVWNELLKIPYGKKETYLGLSMKIGNKKAIRAIASANAANAISIIIPCHRIVGSDGKLVGYAGGLNTKRKLLELESLNDSTVQLKIF